jgi:hypothetical protein
MPSRFAAASIVFWMLATVACALQQPSSPPKPAARFDEETQEVRARIDAVARALVEKSKTTSDVLSDAALLDLHSWPRFRAAIRDAASAKPLVLVTKDEPGIPLTVHGLVRGEDGKPVADALVYLYHTNAKGTYDRDGGPVIADSTTQAHLFGYVRTDKEGRFEVRTVRPASYPETEESAHIHVVLARPGKDPRTVNSEIVFDDDPKLTPAERARERTSGGGVCKVEVDKEKKQTVRPVFVLR